MMKSETDWRKASRQYSRQRFKTLRPTGGSTAGQAICGTCCLGRRRYDGAATSNSLMKDGSLELTMTEYR
jgi:hypothetical protein